MTVPTTPDSTLWDRVSAVALREPTRSAVRDPARSWTYAELVARADAIAAHLDEVDGLDRVACLLSHGGAVAGALGVLAGGRIYVPLDPTHSLERSAFVLADSSARAVLCDATTAALAAELAGDRHVIRIDTIVDGRHPRRRPLPSDLAYCLHTAGATGLPTGVLQRHSNIVHLLDGFARRIELTSADVVTLLFGSASNAAIVDVFATLITGATLCTYDLPAALVNAGVTICHSTPTVWRSVATASTLSPTIRAVVLEGEDIVAEDITRVRSACSSSTALVTVYGVPACSVALVDGTAIDGVKVTLQTAFGPQKTVRGMGTIRIETPYLATGQRYVDTEQGRLLPGGRIELAGRRASGARTEQLAYWRGRLSGAPQDVELPMKGARPRVQTHAGAVVSLLLERELTGGLARLAQRSATTVATAMRAVLRALIYRYTGHQDVCIGVPVVANTVVMRTAVRPEQTFAELIADERTTSLEAFAHQDVPFELVREALGIPRALDRNPLFQITFHAPREQTRRDTTALDIEISATIREEGIQLALLYNTDLFAERTVAQLARHFHALLVAAVAAPETRLADLPLLSPPEANQLVHGWNATRRELPPQTLPAMLDARATAQPDAIAIAGPASSLTYAELVARSNRLAHHLRARGLAREERVALRLDRGPELVVAMLGVLKAGGAYLPIDSELPAERIAYMLDDAGVRITLTDEELAAIDPSTSSAPLPPPAAEQLAYVLYTSGSTGRPKGVHIQHGSLVNFLVSMLDAPGIDERATLLAVTTASFDISGLELYLPLLAGARVHIASKDQARDATQLQALLAQSGATIMQATPATWQMLVESGWHGAPGFVALCGGEALPPALATALTSRVGALWNMYGPTETTIWSARKRIIAGEPIRLGEPIANTALYILDSASLGVQPLEVAGELFIGGDGLARGYGSRPDLTAERFLPDPFSSLPGARMYRTGDRVRRRANGEIEFLGRIDHQVKLRGFRIELGEIEAVLADQPNVAEAVVVVRDEGGEPRLVAYVVTLGAAPSADKLLAAVGARVPDYMVPVAVVFLDKLPLSPAGKIDRRALPAPDRSAFVTAAYQAPRNPIEETLVGIWAELLGVPRVGIDDDFFELGGHSLLAVRVIWAVNKAFSIALPLEGVLSGPTIAELAESVAAAQHDTSPPIVAMDRSGPLPLSYAQQRMWFLHQLDPNGAAYNITTGVRIHGPLDADALRRAIEATIQRHEPLRTLFRSEAGVPHQMIRDVAHAELPIVELTRVPPAEHDAAIARLSREEARMPFSLERDLPVRTRLLRFAPDDHALFATVHHIAADGWSLEPFLTDVARYYTAFSRNEPPALAPLSIQYADYAAWQRGWLVGDVLDKQLAYWKHRLAGAPQDLGLPSRRPRPRLQTYAGASVYLTLERDIADGLARLARRQGTTVITALLAAVRALLYRYTGQSDLCIGVPTANRKDPATEHMVGLFMNTVVMRSDVHPERTFAELVSDERRTALEAYAHQDTPFEMVVEALGVPRALDRNPVFQVLFQAATEHGAPPPVPWGDARETMLTRPRDTTHLDLEISGAIRDDGIDLAFLYNTDLFDQQTVTQLAQHLRAFLLAALATPTLPIAAVPMLSSAERTQVLETWNATERDYSAQPLVPALIAAQVDRTPSSVAVTFEGTSITYRELDDRANRLAHHLLAHGARVDQPIAVCLERSIDMIVSLLAIHKAGAAYIPVDPTYPPLRVRAILDDGGAALVIDRAWLDAHATAIAARSNARPAVAITGANAAYILFTSGSTGRPKGVVITHEGLRNRLLWVSDTFAFAADDSLLQKTPFTFDVSVFELFYPFMRGARLVIAKPEGHRDPAYIAHLIRDEQITFAHFVPSMLGPFVEAARATPSTSLRRVFCSGEALTTSLVRAFTSTFTAELYNLYGPTEATIDVSWWRCDTARERATVPIGSPVANTRLYVLDSSLQPVPAGATGELYIAGVQLARGYSRRPDLTAERFIPDPFHAGERMYRTGDLARFQRDGAIEYLGRIDHQVKIRGLRIELEEIEAVLRAHPAVRDAVVAPKKRSDGDVLVAYLLAGAATTDVLDHARRQLPEYMVPAMLVVLDAFPLTSSGKTDRARLPEPTWSATAATFVAPRDPIEETLTAIWAELLAVPRVGVYDNFFALGGHSLLAVRVAWALNRAFSITLPLDRVLSGPTIAELANAVRAAQGAGTSSLPPIVIADRGAPLPLSYAQQRMWFLHQLEPNAAAYNIASGTRLRGPLDLEAMRRAIEATVQRHESLRTLYRAEAGVPQQVIRDVTRWELPVVDLTSVPAAEQERAFANVSREEAHIPFVLEHDLPLRTKLVRFAPDDHVVFVTIHHIAADGWSLDPFWADVAHYYAAFSQQHAPTLAALPIQYADYAASQRTWLAGDALQKQLAYWKNRLAGAAQEVELPLKGPRPRLQTYAGALVPQVLERDIADGLASLARRHGATVVMTLLAGLRALLYRYTGQEDVCIGVPTANRQDPVLEHMVGLFMGTVVMRTAVHPERSFADLIADERTTALEAYAHQDTPFEMVVDALGVPRALDRSPVFQIMFQAWSDKGAPAATTWGAAREVPLNRPRDTTYLDLDITGAIREDRIELSFFYNTDLFAHETIAQLAKHFRALLVAVIASPETRVSDLPLLSPSEASQLVHGWNVSSREVSPQTLPSLIDARAATRPDAIAVVGPAGSLTYAELVTRSNRLARHLLARGITREERVAIRLDRGPDLVVAMLGVLKAGGAYLPIDSQLPADRISYMLTDAAVRITLTDAELASVDPSTSSAPLPPPAAQQLAYVLYTSGSTGRPKGVHIQHGSLVNFLVSMLDAPGIDDRATLLAVTTASFDISGLELYLPLLAGARVHIASREQARDATQLQALLTGSGATIMQATPATWQMLVESGWRGHPNFVALCGGEALPPALATALTSRVGALWNMYGPTETTVWSARKRISAGEPIRLGEPIANTSLYILDSTSLRVQPLEVAGELFIGGDGLARGYGSRPDLTAERFLPDPFSSVPGARMYRTGDRVRRRAGGEIEFLGRIDHQVKLRGFRIELGEIEAVLADQPNVAEAVVVVREDGGEPRLVAYAVTTGTAPAADKLLAAVGERVPDYMVPVAVVFLDKMPLSPAGKIDRRALPAPDRSAFVTATYQPPRNPVEEALVGIWVEILGVPRVGVHDNFFELGGNSLLTIRLVADIEQKFRVRVPIGEVFEHSTVEKLAIYIEANRGTSQGSRVTYRPTRALEARATSTQEYFWYLDRDDHDPASYLIGRPRILLGSLDADTLARSFRELAAAHSIYRTAYRESNGILIQRVRPAADVPIELEHVDASSLREDQRTEAIAKVAAAQIAPGFDLTTGHGQLRATLLRFAPDHHVLMTTTHHIATDGASLFAFSERLMEGYARLREGAPKAHPDPGLQYIDYAHTRQRWVASRPGQMHEAYWKEYVRGAPAVELEGDFSRDAIDAHRDATPRGVTADLSHPPDIVTLPADIYAKVVEAAHVQRTTPYVIYVTALAWLVRERSGQDDLAIQTAYSARPEDRALQTVPGALAAWTITRMQLDGTARLSDAVERGRVAVAAVQEHGAPYDYYGIVPHRLRRVVLNYVVTAAPPPGPGASAGAAPPDYAGVRTQGFAWPPPVWKRTWDLHLTMVDSGANATLTWTGFSALFKRETVSALLARYIEILATVTDR